MKRNQVILIVLLIIALAALTFSLWRIFRNPKTQNLIPVATTTTATNTESVSVEEKKITNNTDFYEINIKYPEDSRDKNKEIESFILASTERKKDDWKVGGEIYNDEKALTSAMLWMLDHYETYDSASIAKQAKDKYSFHAVGQHLYSIYKEVLSESSQNRKQVTGKKHNSL